MSGSIQALGGNGYSDWSGSGSGGAVRVIASSLTGSGQISAFGGSGSSPGGEGRIRLETNSGGGSLVTLPATAIDTPTTPVMLWSPDSAPSIRIVSVGAKSVTETPTASLGPLPADVRFYSGAPVTVMIETKNVETAVAKVTLRVGPKFGSAVLADATYVSGTTESALWTAEVSVPQGFAALQARVDPK